MAGKGEAWRFFSKRRYCISAQCQWGLASHVLNTAQLSTAGPTSPPLSQGSAFNRPSKVSTAEPIGEKAAADAERAEPSRPLRRSANSLRPARAMRMLAVGGGRAHRQPREGSLRPSSQGNPSPPPRPPLASHPSCWRPHRICARRIRRTERTPLADGRPAGGGCVAVARRGANLSRGGRRDGAEGRVGSEGRVR